MSVTTASLAVKPETVSSAFGIVDVVDEAVLLEVSVGVVEGA